jgi:hypothetical protein
MTYRRIPITIPLAVAVLILSCFAWGSVSGLEKGFFYGLFSNPPTSGFAAHGPNYYQELNSWYFWIVLSAATLIILTFWSSHIGSLIKILLCCFSLISFWNMFDFKLSVLGLDRCCKDYPWLRTSVYLDLFTALALFGILSKELISLVKASSRLETIGEIKN